MKLTKFLLAFLCGVLLVCCLASCGGNNDPKIQEIYLDPEYQNTVVEINGTIYLGDHFITKDSNGDETRVDISSAGIVADTSSIGTFTGTISYMGFQYEFTYTVVDTGTVLTELNSLYNEVSEYLDDDVKTEYLSMIAAIRNAKNQTEINTIAALAHTLLQTEKDIYEFECLRETARNTVNIIFEESGLTGSSVLNAKLLCLTTIDRATSLKEIENAVNGFEAYVEAAKAERELAKLKKDMSTTLVEMCSIINNDPYIRASDKDAFVNICKIAEITINAAESDSEIFEIVEELDYRFRSVPDIFDIVYYASEEIGEIRYTEECIAIMEEFRELNEEMASYSHHPDYTDRLYKYINEDLSEPIDLDKKCSQLFERFETLRNGDASAWVIETLISNIKTITVASYDDLITIYEEIIRWGDKCELIIGSSDGVNEYGFQEFIFIENACEDIIDGYDKYWECWEAYKKIKDARDMELKSIINDILSLEGNLTYTGTDGIGEFISDIEERVRAFVAKAEYDIGLYYDEYFGDHLVNLGLMKVNYQNRVKAVTTISDRFGRLPRMLPTDPVLKDKYFEKYYESDGVILADIANLINEFKQMNDGNIEAVEVIPDYQHYLNYLAAWETFTPTT